MPQQIRPFGTEDFRVGKHNRIDFAYALHGIEKRDEEHQRDSQRYFRPKAQAEPKNKDRRENDTGNCIEALDKGIKDAGCTAAETKPNTGGDAERRAYDIAENGFCQRNGDMLVEAWLDNPGNNLVEDIQRSWKEEYVDDTGGYAQLPATENKNQNTQLDDAFSHDVHSFSPLRRAGLPRYFGTDP